VEEHDDSPPTEEIGSEVPLVEHFQPPRLGITHLLVWIALAAVLFKYVVFTESVAPHLRRLDERVLRGVMALTGSATIVGISVLIRGWWRGDRRRLQPGHWMALFAGAYILWDYLYEATYLTIQIVSLDDLGTVFFFGSLLHPLVLLPFCCLPLVGSREGRRWTVLFVVFAFMAGIAFLAEIEYHFWPSTHIWQRLPQRVGVQLITLAIVLALDIRLGVERDWVHWLGVVAAMVLLLNISGYHLYVGLRCFP
jgi:hypothetical protein